LRVDDLDLVGCLILFDDGGVVRINDVLLGLLLRVGFGVQRRDGGVVFLLRRNLVGVELFLQQRFFAVQGELGER